ncbi:uncharacterized protein [Nicotiana tomentosiformis]|uniref:uncharacterized protein n=1 Tax=Nicotiana tomentosiformis TaxID=4098 RepID=UPI00388CC866
MSTFKSLARTFIGYPSKQEMMKKNVIEALADAQSDQPMYFSKARVLKSEIDFLNRNCPSKEIKMTQQIVTTCQKFLESATSYDPEFTPWMRLAPTKGAESPTSNKWEDVLEMFLDLSNCLSEETKITSDIWDIEVEVCGGLYAIGRGDKFRLCTGKILTSNEQNILQSGVKQLSRVLGRFKFVWETAGMKGDLELLMQDFSLTMRTRKVPPEDDVFSNECVS